MNNIINKFESVCNSGMDFFFNLLDMFMKLKY